LYSTTLSPEIIVKFSIDRTYDEYEVKVFDILDLIGKLGGLFEIAEIIGRLIIGFYSQKLFYHLVINNSK
jgi:sugar phosphate permease